LPKVSIVLPNYNYEKYLDERIQSLLNQTYKDFELIILDDCSTDNSIAVIQKYLTDPRVKTCFFEKNSGSPYKRWNDGADLAHGEYLLFAGADDSCEPTLIEKLVEKLDRHSSVGLALSQSWETDSNGNITRSLKERTDDLFGGKERWNSDYVDRGQGELGFMLFKNTVPNASCVLMRRELFIKAGKFDTKLIINADWMLWSKMLMISDIAYVSEHLNYFRTHPRNVRNQSSQSCLDIEEDCLVRKFILDNSGLSFAPETVRQAFENKLWYWFIAAGNPRNIKNWKRNLRIFGLYFSVDRKFRWQLTRHLSSKLMEEFRTKAGALRSGK
jgi:glycosyltransferase involved in cell wall biosynthesis